MNVIEVDFRKKPAVVAVDEQVAGIRNTVAALSQNITDLRSYADAKDGVQEAVAEADVSLREAAKDITHAMETMTEVIDHFMREMRALSQ